MEKGRRKVQQANDLAANAQRALLAGKKSKSNSKRSVGSVDKKTSNDSHRLPAGQHHPPGSAVTRKASAHVSYADAAKSSPTVSPPVVLAPDAAISSPPTSSAPAVASKKRDEFARSGGTTLPPTSSSATLPPTSTKMSGRPTMIPHDKRVKINAIGIHNGMIGRVTEEELAGFGRCMVRPENSEEFKRVGYLYFSPRDFIVIP